MAEVIIVFIAVSAAQIAPVKLIKSVARMLPGIGGLLLSNNTVGWEGREGKGKNTVGWTVQFGFPVIAAVISNSISGRILIMSEARAAHCQLCVATSLATCPSL